MVYDALISVGVVIVGILVTLTSWYWLDPLVSLFIGAIIIYGSWQLLRDTLHLTMQGVPSRIDTEKLREHLKGLKGVKAIHDLHVWPLSTTETAMTVHLLMPAGHPGDGFLWELDSFLKKEFNIHHCTVQIEVSDSSVRCQLEPDEVV
jgi:cobalt-zinc-cadmium efflux system protein